MRRLAALALLPLLAAAPRGVHAGPEDAAPGCRHWAVLLPEDAGQHRIYDGIRKGLEVAQLERLCLKDLADTEAAFRGFVAEHAALPEPRPLVFMVGRRAGDRLLAAGFEGPGVYISTTWTAKGAPLQDEPGLPPSVVRVRAELPAETLGQVLRDALGDPRPRVAWAWTTDDARLGTAVTRLVGAAGLAPDVGGSDDTGGLRAQLDLRPGPDLRYAAHAWDPPLGESDPSAGRVVYVSDNVARYGTGAAIVLVPDHERLGRIAAEAGRKLWRGESGTQGAHTAAAVLRGMQVLVDLDACRRQGVSPPLSFLAGVDGLKGRRMGAGAGR